MTYSPQMLSLLIIGLGGAVLAKCILTTLAVRIQLEMKRHELICEAKLRRIAYMHHLAERSAGVDIEHAD